MYAMKLSQIRTFVTIVDDGGFARAAERLLLTQSAASRQINMLESELGVTLFERAGRNVRLTSQGEDLLIPCRRLLADTAAIGERAQTLKSGKTGALRVSAPSQVIENLLAPFCGRFTTHHPGIVLRLVESGGEKQLRQLERGDVDLALMGATDERFDATPLYPNHVLAVARRSHRWRGRTMLEVGDLTGEPLLVLTRDFGSRIWFDAACNMANIIPQVAFEGAAPMTLVALAGVGHGIAIVPSNIARLRDEVRSLPLAHRGQPIGKWSVVAWNGQRYLPPFAEEFVVELVDHARRKFPGRELTRRAPPITPPELRGSFESSGSNRRRQSK
jgi:LysR family transcriptional regulator, cyn operon transcriptional activator